MTLWRGPGSFTQGFQGPWTFHPGEACGSAASGKGAGKGRVLVCVLLLEHTWSPQQAAGHNKHKGSFLLSFDIKHRLCRQCTMSRIYYQGHIDFGLKVHDIHVPSFPILRKSQEVPQDTAECSPLLHCETLRVNHSRAKTDSCSVLQPCT